MSFQTLVEMARSLALVWGASFSFSSNVNPYAWSDL